MPRGGSVPCFYKRLKSTAVGCRFLVMGITTFLDPTDTYVSGHMPDPEDVLWVRQTRAEWAGSGNPSAIRRGIFITAFLRGEEVSRASVQDASGWDDPRVETATETAKLYLVGVDGRRHLAALQRQIASLDDGWAGTEYASRHDDEEDDAAERRSYYEKSIAGQGRGTDTPSGRHVAETDAAVAANRDRLTALQDELAWMRWDLLAHLHRHGATPAQIAAHLDTAPELISRRITCVPTTVAAHLCGISPKTWSAYVSRSEAPQPDDHVGREPVWHLDTIMQFIAERPGVPGRPRASKP